MPIKGLFVARKLCKVIYIIQEYMVTLILFTFYMKAICNNLGSGGKKRLVFTCITERNQLP